MNRFEPMKRPRPTAERESWVTYANSLERRVEAASSYIDRLPMNWRELEARVAELEAALRKLHHLGASPGDMNREEIRRECERVAEHALKGTDLEN